MAVTTRPSFHFGPYRVDPEERCLYRDDGPVALPPKVLDVLLALVEHAGHVVPKSDLIAQVWPDTFVEEANLTVHVSALRKVLGDGYIETIPKRGYRFVTPVGSGAVVEPRVESSAPSVHGAGRRRAAWYASGAVALIGAVAAIAAFGFRPSAPRTVTLAVAPFDNPSHDEAAGQLVSDLARAVAARLTATSRHIELRAVPNTGAPQSPPHWSDLAALGRSLHVEAVLTGRIIQKQQSWIIQVELMNVRDGALLWVKDYPGQSLTSVYAVEDEVVAEVARHLPVSLSPEERRGLQPHRPRIAQAAQFAERADALFFQATPTSLRRAIEYANQAIALDPTYGAPYGQIASAYSLMGDTDVLAPDDGAQRAREWQRRAMQVDDAVYTSHITTLAPVERRWDWSGPRRAGNLHPFYDDFLIAMGRLDEVIDREVADPPAQANFLSDFSRGQTAYFSRQYDRAITSYGAALELDPGFLWAHLWRGRAYAEQRRFADAIAELKVAAELPRAAGLLGHAYAMSGQRAAARRLRDELLARSRHEYVTPINFAWIELGLGNVDGAFVWLRRACDTHVTALAVIRADPIYDSLRKDPRYGELLTCVGVGD